MKNASRIESKGMLVLKKLFLAGYKTEKEIQNIPMIDLLKMSNMSKQDMLTVCELQEAIQSKKIISFLSGYNSEEPQSPPEPEPLEDLPIITGGQEDAE